MKNFLLSINDLTHADIKQVYALAKDLKKNPKKFGRKLDGRMFGLIFEKPSTRTWVSFESGIFGLGGSSIYLGPNDIKLGIREEIKDVARVLDRYLGGVILRTFDHATITEFQKYFRGPVINGLSDQEHPCQALGDYLTIEEKFGSMKKPVVAFVGDGNNVLNSLLLLAAKLGGRLRYATPRGLEPSRGIVAEARKIARKTGAEIEGSHDPAKAARGAQVIYTDVWVSMGEEKRRKQKMKCFKGFQVNRTLVGKAARGAMVMHCLPAHRGEEITDEILEGKQSAVFDQAENRLHIQKAIMVALCLNSKSKKKSNR